MEEDKDQFSGVLKDCAGRYVGFIPPKRKFWHRIFDCFADYGDIIGFVFGLIAVICSAVSLTALAILGMNAR